MACQKVCKQGRDDIIVKVNLQSPPYIFLHYMSILANQAKLANMPGISIKPDMTQEQRKTEKILLYERKKLIQNGTDKKLSDYEEIVSTCKVKSTDQLQTLYTRPKCLPLDHQQCHRLGT